MILDRLQSQYQNWTLTESFAVAYLMREHGYTYQGALDYYYGWLGIY